MFLGGVAAIIERPAASGVWVRRVPAKGRGVLGVASQAQWMQEARPANTAFYPFLTGRHVNVERVGGILVARIGAHALIAPHLEIPLTVFALTDAVWTHGYS